MCFDEILDLQIIVKKADLNKLSQLRHKGTTKRFFYSILEIAVLVTNCPKIVLNSFIEAQ